MSRNTSGAAPDMAFINMKDQTELPSMITFYSNWCLAAFSMPHKLIPYRVDVVDSGSPAIM
jgi:hypothetical protein